MSAFIIGLPAFGIGFYFNKNAPDAVITRHVSALAAMIFAALHIHQAGGLIEVHFEIFILMAMLIVYRDWRVFLTAISVVAVHHLAFYFMQTNDIGVYIFDANRLAFTTVIIHAGYAITEAVVASYIAITMAEESKAGAELTDAASNITANNEIDLNVKTDAKDNATLISFNELLTTLSTVIEGVKQQVNELNINADNLILTKSKLHESSLQRQLESNSIAAATEQMSVTIGAISDETSQLSNEMLEATKFTQSTNECIHNINDKNQSLAQALQETSDQVRELANSSEAISSVLAEISGIAEQTNLLALNAAIEAARAGEQGRGFAVVADEVRALANRTKESTDKINQTLSLLQGYSKSSTEAMASSIDIVEVVEKEAREAQELISNASALVQQASDISNNVANAVQEQKQTTESIAQSTETLKATVDDDLAKVEELGQESQALTDTANAMELNIAKFK
jgi:methyl-accepting chemotaxis protein